MTSNTPKVQKDWQVIYPVYLNSNRKRSEGRRIAASKGVANPSVNEILEVCKNLGFEAIAENDKCYSRDFLQRGRVRVFLKNGGVPVNEAIQNKNQLLLKIGELIPKLASRNRPQTQQQKSNKQTQPQNNSNKPQNKQPQPTGKKGKKRK